MPCQLIDLQKIWIFVYFLARWSIQHGTDFCPPGPFPAGNGSACAGCSISAWASPHACAASNTPKESELSALPISSGMRVSSGGVASELDEEPITAIPLMQLPGGMQEARSIPDRGGHFVVGFGYWCAAFAGRWSISLLALGRPAWSHNFVRWLHLGQENPLISGHPLFAIPIPAASHPVCKRPPFPCASTLADSTLGWSKGLMPRTVTGHSRCQFPGEELPAQVVQVIDLNP